MLHERLQLFDHHLPVGVGLAAAQPLVFHRRVFVNPMHPGVVDADNHQRLDFAGSDQCVRGFAHAPVVALDERGVRVEQVLAVLQ